MTNNNIKFSDFTLSAISGHAEADLTTSDFSHSSHPEYASKASGGLPCLNSNISIEILRKYQELSTQQRKSAFVLNQSIDHLGAKYGLEKLGFLTLTFADHVTDPKEAQNRLNSLLSNVIKLRYRDYVGVFERQKSQRIHYHLLVVLHDDIRTGFNHDEVSKRNYQSASKSIRTEWNFWRSTARKYKFGRTELLPVKSTLEAMSKYVGKYVSKHVENRIPIDKGVRLVRYSRGARAGTTRFNFYSDGSAKWRFGCALLAAKINDHYGENVIVDIGDFSKILGKRWAYNHRDLIMDPNSELLQTNGAL